MRKNYIFEVAIKITIAAGDPVDSQESNILRQLGVVGLKGKSHAGEAYVPRILDVFSISGPNEPSRSQRCLVCSALPAACSQSHHGATGPSGGVSAHAGYCPCG